MFVKHAYVKDRGKQMIHLIVSAPVFIRYADEDVWEMGRQIADIFRGHQVVFAVHDDIQYMHLHFAINTICMFDGSKLQFNPPCLREKMSRIIQVQYSGSVVKTDFYAIYNESDECMFCSVHEHTILFIA